MADYTPIFFPGEVIPLTASGGVAGGDLVVVSGSGTIANAGALAATTYVGVAAQDAGANTRVGVLPGHRPRVDRRWHGHGRGPGDDHEHGQPAGQDRPGRDHPHTCGRDDLAGCDRGRPDHSGRWPKGPLDADLRSADA